MRGFRGGCEALSSLANEAKQVVRKIIELGGFSAIVHCMNLHADAETQYCALIALISLIDALDDIAVATFLDAGGLSTIITCTRNYPRHVDIQIQTSHIICRMVEEEKAAHHIVRAGGIALIIASMIEHPEAEELHAYLCSTLYSLAQWDNNASLIVSANGVNALLQSIRQHNDNPTIRRNGNAALGCLRGVGELRSRTGSVDHLQVRQ
jgi:hypothetical protein